MSISDIVFDYERAARIGLDEAVFCAGKSVAQIDALLEGAQARGANLLLTRLPPDRFAALSPRFIDRIDYCDVSLTGFFGRLPPIFSTGQVAVVAAGTSDAPVVEEAVRTLRHAGVKATRIIDVGVAGLWRLMDRIEEIRRHRIVIVVAGMDAALASVLAGLVPGVLIGVPTSVGYGAADGGRTALNAMLASCGPGITVCNIDNGYGAATAGLRILSSAAIA